MHDDLCISDPCVIFALKRESESFLREFRPKQKWPGAPCLARFCGPEWLSVLVVETGIGRKSVATALDWLLSEPEFEGVKCRPKVVISAGFSGSLNSRLSVGDVILAKEIVADSGEVVPITWPGELPAGDWKPTLNQGRILCHRRLIGDPVEKQQLGRRHDALAVDMESAEIAQKCQSHSIPFGCVRVISDNVNTPLSPALLSLLSHGRVAPLRLATSLIRNPQLSVELWRLARDTKLAAQQLGLALSELLTLTLPFGREL